MSVLSCQWRTCMAGLLRHLCFGAVKDQQKFQKNTQLKNILFIEVPNPVIVNELFDSA